MENKPYLSVIIPAYNEIEIIGRTLVEIHNYLSPKDFDYEILVIVDGSPNRIAEVVKNHLTQVKKLLLVDNQTNHGKGYVVRQGLLLSKAKYRLFMDADGSTSIDHLEKFLQECQKGYDVVIGSRKIEGAVIQAHQPKYREIMGDLGNLFIRVVLGLWEYPDTQCGFKILSGRAAQSIASRMVVDRFGFDFELIILAKKLEFRIKQMPVRWRNEKGSSVKFIGPNSFSQILLDLLKTKYRLIKGLYNIEKQRKSIETNHQQN